MTPGDPWTQQLEAFGRFFTDEHKLAEPQLRELAARTRQAATAATESTQSRPQAIADTVTSWSRAIEKLMFAAAAPAVAKQAEP